MKQSEMNKADFLTSLVLVAFGLAVVILSVQMPRFESRNANPYSVPGIVPGLLGIVIGVLGLVLLIRSVRSGGYRLNLRGFSLTAYLADEATKRMVVTIAICLFYAFVMIGRIPYLPATIIFIAMFVITFEYRRVDPVETRVRTVLFALLLAGISGGVIWAVFRYLFLVSLPN
jgi:hypothetical protein